MKKIFLFLVTTCLVGSHQFIKAQECGIWYDTELQTDFHGNYNHVNLLYLSAEYSLRNHLNFSAATISIAKTREERLLDDLQVFSNIEEDNLPLALALAGVEWQINDRHTLFMGIRNVNEDYFTSPLTSLFTNSSCGIFPTLSCNLPIANYPLASAGIHYAYNSPNFTLLTSIYNGSGYNRWAGHDNIWKVSPYKDGLFLITQGKWSSQKGKYFVGGCLHTGTQSEPSAKSALWCYTEQKITDHFSWIADYSHAFGNGCECLDFAGLGLQYEQRNNTFGIFSNYARFCDNTEYATELTYKYQFNKSVFIQASCHLISMSSLHPIGLLRLGVRL